MRLFFALWPDEATRAALAALQNGLTGRRTKHGNLHMTLAFLGEQPELMRSSLQDLLHELTVPVMHLSIDHVVYRKRQRMMWACMHRAPEPLYDFQRALFSGLELRGVAFDRRNRFTPHVTLARDASPVDPIRFEPILWRADQVALVQSVNETSGVVYRVLASQFSDEALNK